MVCNLIRILLFEAFIFLPEMFGKYRHGSGRYMERAECAPEGLKRCDDLGILPVPAFFEIAKRDDFNQIKEGNRLLSSCFVQLPIEIPAKR